MAVAFYDVIPAGWQKSDPRIRNLKIPFEKVQHYQQVKKVRVGSFVSRLYRAYWSSPGFSPRLQSFHNETHLMMHQSHKKEYTMRGRNPF